MPWQRVEGDKPPDTAQMNTWEAEGWERIQVLGPCPTKGGQAYAVYLWRSEARVVRPLPGQVTGLNRAGRRQAGRAKHEQH